MRIAISAKTKDQLNSQVAQHFGRCPYFALVDVKGQEIQAVEVVENPFFSSHEVGQVPKFIQEQKAEVMLSGGMGRRAIQFFSQFGIDTATGASGTVQDTLASYFEGKLVGASPCADSVEHDHGHHHGHGGNH